ncbi:translation initiation factor IF-2 subunit beta [Halomicrobium sp. IBSBa]|uniref:translation initiation factor IF-2 subunit beta n=1 Tax=Halomicrobium sp. IBSBa TaxID=2778916 RepID=UPI001ABF0D0D|nr:translation initiation factor IF-2 subunit beta [Halomicrobium sp. IBSBa]MBO4246242.1 translation initiation factor IF-2 subunit beta [Halomicrobium sp. IBSBa]
MDYDEMLDQAIEETPEIEGDGERFKIPDPDLRQEGNATVFENFQSVCDRLSRADEHVMQFLQNEVGTSGHIDESGRARLTGEFRERRIADALDAYADAYVLCPECGLPDTKLKDEQGATVLRCEACGAQSPAGP